MSVTIPRALYRPISSINEPENYVEKNKHRRGEKKDKKTGGKLIVNYLPVRLLNKFPRFLKEILALRSGLAEKLLDFFHILYSLREIFYKYRYYFIIFFSLSQ